jgi:small GTP-binding protein
MTNDFSFDVFLCYSSKDNPIVRPLAERLRKDGLRVWFDEWELKPGDFFPKKIDDGLEQSRVLVLCMSANAFGSDWAQLEEGTFRFRDPLNRGRRFIPLRLDEAPIKGSLAHFLYVNWLQVDQEQEYPKLLEACRQPAKPLLTRTKAKTADEQVAEKAIQLDYTGTRILSYAFSLEGKQALTGSETETVVLWDLDTGRCLRLFEGHAKQVNSVAWSINQRLALSGSLDGTVRLWDVKTGRCLREFKGHSSFVLGVTWSADQRRALSAAQDETVRVWDLVEGNCLTVFEGHTDGVSSVAWSADGRFALSGANDRTVRLWEVETGRCLSVLEGHTSFVTSVAWRADGRFALSGAGDKTVRLWEIETGRCLSVLEGHMESVMSVAWSANQRYALSGSADTTVRLWEMETGHCLRVLKGHKGSVLGVAWSADGRYAFSGDLSGGIRRWDLSEFFTETRIGQTAVPDLLPALSQVQYTNAKVLLVGESGVGKTGLSKVLAGEKWQPSDSTVGAWATQWKLPVSTDDDVEREIWLWDFGGQADQRLIHQLYMEDTALVVLVFDGQKEDLFETLGQWDRELARSSRKPFTKILVAGRVDAGGLRASRNQVETFVKERGFAGYLETSAKTKLGCHKLKEAILTGIRWADIPWRSSPKLFKRLKDEILRLKDAGRVLMRFNELRDALRLRLAGEDGQFKDEELKAVVGLLAGPGVVWELAFGNWVLLQPERINAYAQAVIQTLRADEHERGAIAEERVLRGDMTYTSSIDRLEAAEERFVLLAMHQTLVERGLCLREHTAKGPLLIFPSYYLRERPELVGHPVALASYRFNGFLDDIYATLVVRLHHTGLFVRLHHTAPFEQDELWRYSAHFKTLTGKQLGVKLTRRAEGAGELEVYFDSPISVEEKIIFSRYVYEHLLQKGQNVTRLRHYVCPHCGTPVGNRELAMERLEKWLEQKATKQATGVSIRGLLAKANSPTIICSKCEKRVPLWDDLEQCFASPEMQQRVRELQEQSALVLHNESKERALVGEVISTVALAGQISREFNVSDHGIDMEIEFNNDAGKATGKKLYLQIKWGDSYLCQRQRGEKEMFVIKEEQHALYWMKQEFPVMLVIRTSKGEVRWMEVRNWLKRASAKSEKPVNQIVFEGDRFDVMSVRRWRDDALK